jgi:hypothetical protein
MLEEMTGSWTRPKLKNDKGVEHNALNDAKHQARYVCDALSAPPGGARASSDIENLFG